MEYERDFSVDELDWSETRCPICGEWHRESMERIGHHEVCAECAENAVVCENCGDVFDKDFMTECVGGTGEVYFLCSNCIGGEQIAEPEVID